MSEKVYPVPAQWKKRAYVDDADYKEMYAESVEVAGEILGKARQAASTGSRPRPRSRTRPLPMTMSRSNGSRTASSMSRSTASTGI